MFLSGWEKLVPSRLAARVAAPGREIAAFRKLILQGMRMINSLAVSWRELQASQRKTEAMLQVFITSMTRGGKGHSKASRQF